MIKRYEVENTDNTYLRIWQKIVFDKQILEPDFFKEKKIANLEDSYKFSVYQYNPNTRIAFINEHLYWVTSDEPIYNYLDTGRAVIVERKGYYRNSNAIYYIFNDMLITDNVIKSFENYQDKKNLNLKVLTETEFDKFILVYNEDLEKIKHRLSEIEAEEKRIEKAEQEEKLKDIKENEKFASLIRHYDKMTLLEDNDIIISGNYFIDKAKGFKIEFKDKVVKIFDKEDLINENRNYENDFIRISYNSFLQKLDEVYRLGKYENPIQEKLTRLDKRWLNFKIYSYNPDTKEETFLKDIKIENLTNKTGKLRYRVNNIKMPIQKMSKVIDFIGGGRWYVEKTILDERIENLENYLEKIRLYSGTQLELLQGKTIEIKLKNMVIPIHFNLMAEDKDNWKIGIDNLVLERNYKFIKENFRWVSGGGLSTISNICDNLQAGEELENILINKVKEYVDKRRKAEERAEGLFKEFLEKNKTKVFVKDKGYVVKGKLKNYIVKMKNDQDVGVWTYPANEYICINEKTKAGRYLCKYDKLLQFCMVMLNDGNLREEIHTIR